MNREIVAMTVAHVITAGFFDRDNGGIYKEYVGTCDRNVCIYVEPVARVITAEKQDGYSYTMCDCNSWTEYRKFMDFIYEALGLE